MTGLILEAHTVFTPLSDAALEALHPLNKKVYMRVHGAMISDWTRETEQSYNPMYNQKTWERGLKIAATTDHTSVIADLNKWAIDCEIWPPLDQNGD